MLNWAARYYPIVRILKTHGLFDSASLLEIGSGPIGIGRFRKVPFVGCDISFPFEPKWPMTPMIASAAQLPLKDNEFDVVIASDVLEHVPPNQRKAVIGETLRVARRFVIFGFPCGKLAWESDRALLEAYLKDKVTPPEWLTELAKRRPKNVAVVAMANKMARTIWALMAHEREYQFGYVSRPA